MRSSLDSVVYLNGKVTCAGWANGITVPIIDKVKNCFDNETLVPDTFSIDFP